MRRWILFDFFLASATASWGHVAVRTSYFSFSSNLSHTDLFDNLPFVSADINLETGPLAKLAIHIDKPSILLDDAIDGGKPKTASFS